MPKSITWRNTVVRPEIALVAAACLATFAAACLALIAAGKEMYSLLPGIALLGAFWIGKYPHYAFLLVLAMVPYGKFIGDLHWLISAAICGAVGIYYLACKRWPERLKSPLWFWIFCFLTINLTSTLFSPFAETSAENLVKLTMGYFFVALILVLVNSRGFHHWIPLILCVSITGSGLLAVYGYMFNDPLFASNIDQFKRGSGATVSPVGLSVMIIYVFPFLAYYLFSLEPRKKPLALAGIVIAVAAMITTLSRGGFLLLLMMGALVGIAYVRDMKARNFMFLVLIGVVLIACALPLVPEKYWERQETLTDETNGSVSRRLAYLQVGAAAFERAPVLGHGTYSFKHIYADSYLAREHASSKELEDGRLERHAHNTYMEVLAGSGLLGLLFYLGLNWCALRNYTVARRMFEEQGRIKEAKLVSAYRLAFLGLLAYLLIQSDLMHKHILLSIGLSQVAVREAKLGGKNSADEETHSIF